jgi:hypothetical protein
MFPGTDRTVPSAFHLSKKMAVFSLTALLTGRVPPPEKKILAVPGLTAYTEEVGQIRESRWVHVL